MLRKAVLDLGQWRPRNSGGSILHRDVLHFWVSSTSLPTTCPWP